MCETCGCGETTVLHQRETEQKKIELEEKVLSKNDRLAERNRGIFEAMKVMVVNLVSSPGAGKTTLLERTIRELKGEMTIGVIEGDQQTDRDSKRIAATGVKVHQINTIDACHLDAHMIRHALDNFSLKELDLLFIENVGNLICPGSFDLGEDFRGVVLSTPEGEDKPLKYPGIFIDSHIVLINKIDLLKVLEMDLEQCLSFVKKVNPSVQCLCVSARTGEGMGGWYAWLREKVKEKGVE
ncbi:MAG: hydrogenase nickel incorporation protein HypB [Deltaproteobacteria bacterium]|nr:hydrogenase nickel incorporation protein HypB [Deltaproteobacteria bacterium]